MVELPSSFEKIDTVILDMDGVLTSEQAYWDSAGLVIQDILESPAFLGLNPHAFSPVLDVFYQRLIRGSRMEWRKYLPPDIITHFKTKGINSNWDLAYIVLGLYLALLYRTPITALFHHVNQPNEQEPTDARDIPIDVPAEINMMQSSLEPVWESVLASVKEKRWQDILRLDQMYLWGDYFRRKGVQVSPISHVDLRIMDDFHPDVRGLALLHEVNHLIDRQHRHRIELFGRESLLWEDCRLLFQTWYLGNSLYNEFYDTSFPYNSKPGLIHGEIPLHGNEKTHECLSKLRNAEFTLGISTGRPKREIFTPLEGWDMLRYFSPNRISTYDEVEAAEMELQTTGYSKALGKPHPFIFLRSIYPGTDTKTLSEMESLIPDAESVLIVGDSLADIWAAKTIGCRTAAVLSGAIGPSSKKEMEAAHPDVICRDMIELTEALIQMKQAKGNPAP